MCIIKPIILNIKLKEKIFNQYPLLGKKMRLMILSGKKEEISKAHWDLSYPNTDEIIKITDKEFEIISFDYT